MAESLMPAYQCYALCISLLYFMFTGTNKIVKGKKI